jgi:hypothetical protein
LALALPDKFYGLLAEGSSPSSSGRRKKAENALIPKQRPPDFPSGGLFKHNPRISVAFHLFEQYNVSVQRNSFGLSKENGKTGGMENETAYA